MANQLHTTHSPEETQGIAAALANSLRPGDVLALSGDLGAGKTCFIQGLAVGLGVQEAVNSPTFTLVHEYQGRLPLYHMDLYRIHHADEALDFGLEEYLDGDGVTAIEWCERVISILPRKTIHVRIEHGRTPEERFVHIIHASGAAAPADR